METKPYMIIDGLPVEINGEKNVLELIRKAGIEMPTFCYYSELSIYGACRMCLVEDERGGLDSACSAHPRAGGVVRTNTERLRKYRKTILELLLANHCRDCTLCGKNGNCKLQDLAMRFDIERVRFPNTAAEPKLDTSSVCITRDQSKCILCGDCVRMCKEVQDVGAIDFAHRGSKMTISTVFDAPLASSNCVGCGQCAAVCPTGAIVVHNDTDMVYKALDDKEIIVIAQVAPAVRVAVGRAFGFDEGENVMGKIVTALRRIGFDEVFDTSTGADLTVIEESNELNERLKNNNPPGTMPLFTSCCPAWVRHCEQNHPDILPHLSTSKSPMHMFAAVIKEHFKVSGKKVVHVAVMPCTAKKYEAQRAEFKAGGAPQIDYVLSTQELIRMIKERGIVFSELEAEAIDAPFGSVTGAGMIFGVTGGVTEAVLRKLSSDKSNSALMAITYQGVRGMEGIKTTSITLGEREVKIAIVSGLKNAGDIIARIKAGEHYDFVEVMACPGGCISGAGQPFTASEGKQARGKGLYSAGKMCSVKRSEESPLMSSLYDGMLKGREHELLHVSYQKRS